MSQTPISQDSAKHIEALCVASEPDAFATQTALADLYARYQSQQKLLDRVVRISDGFQRAERERGSQAQADYEREIRRIEKIIRISDSFQSMLRDRESELRVAKQHAEQALEDQRQFLAMASHEFKSPLAVIDSAAQLLDVLCQNNVDASPVVERIRRATKRLSNFLQDCLIEDRLDTHHWKLSAQLTDIGGLLQSVVEHAQNSTQEHQIELEVSLEGHPFYADPTLLRVMLDNLIDNAIKYTPEGGLITLCAIQQAEELTLEIIDNGMGISADDLPRIFSKYVRGQIGGGIPGAGLGLHLVNKIVGLHQGTIAVDSTLGEGSCFTVVLPSANQKPSPATL